MKSKQQMIYDEMCYQLIQVLVAPEHEYIDDKGVDNSAEVNEINVKLVMSSVTTTLIKCALAYGIPIENVITNIKVGYEVFEKGTTNE